MRWETGRSEWDTEECRTLICDKAGLKHTLHLSSFWRLKDTSNMFTSLCCIIQNLNAQDVKHYGKVFTEVSNKLIFSQFSVNRWKVTLLNLQVYSVIPTFLYYLLLKVKDKTVKKFELQAVLTCLFCCCAQVRRTAQVVLQVSKVPIHLTHSVLQTAENQNEDDSF